MKTTSKLTIKTKLLKKKKEREKGRKTSDPITVEKDTYST